MILARGLLIASCFASGLTVASARTTSAPGIGPAGPPGASGVAGPQGAQGAQGNAGAAGPTGPKGDAGPSGATGAAGPTGATGPQGSPGPAGAIGPAGATGSPGAKGETGPTGAQGATGQAGPQGLTGPAGSPGPTGATGSQGPQGATGPKASQFVCNTSIGETSIITVAAGIRTVSGVTCAGVLTTDLLEVYPTNPGAFPAGYAIHHALPTAANQFRAVVNVPVLSVATTYSIPVAVYSVNR